MGKSMKYFLFIIFTFTTILFAGDQDRIGINNPILLTQGIVSDSYQSIGFSNCISGTIMDISSANPASINLFNSLSFGLNIEYSTPIDNVIFSDINYERMNQLLPTSAAIVYPLNNFRIGLAYHQKYSALLDFGEIPITTIDDPDGISGETISPIFETTIYSYSILAGYSFNELFRKGDKLSFGVQLFYDYLNSKEDIGTMVNTRKNGDYSWKVGTVYKANEQLSIGLLFENGVNISGKNSINSENLVISIPPITESKYNVLLPSKLALGLSLNPTSNLSFSASIASIMWNSIDNNNKNTMELSANGIYHFPNLFDISLGFYNTNRKYEESLFQYDLSATFINTAIRIPIKKSTIICEIIDSHLFSGERRKLTTIKLGLGYSI
jgi:hypothetical protein